MVWFRVDDSLADHPKLLELQAQKGWQGALALWTLAGSWCGKHLTNGYVPASVVKRLACSQRDAELLCDVGFWERAEGGYTFHDWKARNPLREQVETEREKTRNRVAKSRGNANRNGVTEGVRTPVSTPAPSHPDPSHPSKQACSDSARPEDVSREWHTSMRDTSPTSMHALHSWRADYETVAGACNGLDEPQTAVLALCRWFWLAADGPVQAGRVRAAYATPGHLAKHVSTDLLAAAAWWANQQEAAQ
jgi:hypothetical protein